MRARTFLWSPYNFKQSVIELSHTKQSNFVLSSLGLQLGSEQGIHNFAELVMRMASGGKIISMIPFYLNSSKTDSPHSALPTRIASKRRCELMTSASSPP